jgi:PAS domain S-box-containing protein
LNESSIVAITDQKGIIKYANKNFCRISKYSAEELIGQDHCLLNSGYHPKSYIKDLWTTIAKGKIWKGEFCNKAKDGSIYWVDATIVPFLNKHGKPYQYLSIRSDITERKNAEKELAEKEFFLRESQRAGNIGSYKTNFATGHWQSSETLDRIFGIDKNYDRSIAGWLDIVHPEDRQMMEDYLQAEVISKRKSFNKEYRIKRINDKQTKWVCGMGDLKFDDSGNITELIGTIQDISERKRAEEDLAELNQFNKQIIDSAQDGIIVYDLNMRYLAWNPFMEKITGMPASQVLGKHPSELFPFLKAAGVIESFKKALAGEIVTTPDFHFNIPGTELSGWAFDTNAPLRNPKGEIIGVIGVVRDITERKKAEDLLFLSRQNYKNLLENMNDGFMVDDISGKVTFVNKRFREIFGFTEADVNELVIEDYVAPDYAELLRDRHNNRIAGENVPDVFIFEGLRKNGKKIWLEVRVNQIIKDGIITGTQSVISDITERKKAEDALLESEETFRRLFNESADPILLLDDTGFTECNQAAAFILGYSSPGEVLIKHPWEISPEKQPDGRLSTEKAVAMISKALLNGYNRFEWIHTKTDGTEFPVEVMLTPIILKGEQSFYTVWRDITERKKAEEDIRCSEIRLNEAQAIAHISNWEVDMVQNIHTWSDEFYRIYGLNKSEVKPSAKLLLSFIHPDDANIAQKKIRKSFEIFCDSSFNFRFIRKDGITMVMQNGGMNLTKKETRSGFLGSCRT